MNSNFTFHTQPINVCKFNFRDPNILVETISFASVGKLQPFLISLNTSALIVMEVHCSLTHSEVVGYLAGVWDMNSNSKYSYKISSYLLLIKQILFSIDNKASLSLLEPACRQ